MIKRKLETIGDSKLLKLEPFLLEYLGLNNTDKVDIKIENETMVISRSFIDKYDATDETNYRKEKASQHIRDFFKDGRLQPGDEVIYYQAVEEGKAKVDDIAVQAVIERDANGYQKYLKYKKDNQLYSFSGLRKKLIADFELKEVHSDWVFTLNDEWRELKSNKRLSEL